MKSSIKSLILIFLLSFKSISSQEVNNSKFKNQSTDIKTTQENEELSSDLRKKQTTYQSNWFTSKVGEGFTITSDDGESLINIRLRAQFRATNKIVPEDKNKEGTSFEIRRLRMINRGKIKGDEWQYNVQFGFAERDQELDKDVPLRDAILTYNGFDRIKFSFGQMKVPFNRQRLISSGALQLVDRSIVNAELNLDRDVGIQAFTNDLFGLSNFIGLNIGVFGGEETELTKGQDY